MTAAERRMEQLEEALLGASKRIVAVEGRLRRVLELLAAQQEYDLSYWTKGSIASELINLPPPTQENPHVENNRELP